MSLDNVQVNMSRLALARAIKTPDGDDTEADPWNKSVIFNQSHIPQAIEQRRRQERNRGTPVPRQARSSRLQQEKVSPPPSLQQQRRPSPQPVNGRKAGLRKTYIPSDDEEEDEEEEESDEDEEDESSNSEDEKLNSRTKKSAPVSQTLHMEEPTNTSNMKQARKQPLPSDDEDSSGSENEDDEDDDSSVDATSTQRHSTPVRLQNEARYSSAGSSNNGSLAAHQRSRSLGDVISAPSRSPIPHVQNDLTLPQPKDQWRKSADYMGRSGDMHDGQSPTNVFKHGRSKSSDKLEKMPLAKPSTPIPGRPRRKSTMVDYEGTHQQQKLTYHAAPQFGQFQQYPPNMNRKNQSNRMSMSGMDMLLQLEHEKQQAIKGKPKKLDSTNAPIEGLLAKLPESGAYNVNFQQLQGHQMPGSRAHRLETSARDSYKPNKTRPNSAMGYFDARPHVSPSPSPSPDHRRSRLSPRMEAPYPTSSISTPASHLQRQYQQQMLMMDQQQQMLQNQYLVSGQMLQVPMNYGQMMPSLSPDAAMRHSMNRPSSSMAKRSSSAWGAY
ncbi:unnamed protein product [Umbelopsis sp. WA50703]